MLVDLGLALVAHFHETYGQPIKHRPNIDDDELNGLRVDLIKEEAEELEKALSERDPVAVLDALTDLQYVLDGAYLSLGFHQLKAEALCEVHRSNMSKLDEHGKPIYRADGKVLKGPNYTPPDLKSIVEGL